MYLLIDRLGNQRAAFDTREELVEELAEGDAFSPGAASEFFVVTHEHGRPVGQTERGDEVLRRMRSHVLLASTSAVASQAGMATATITLESRAISWPRQAARRRSRAASA